MGDSFDTLPLANPLAAAQQQDSLLLPLSLPCAKDSNWGRAGAGLALPFIYFFSWLSPVQIIQPAGNAGDMHIYLLLFKSIKPQEECESCTIRDIFQNLDPPVVLIPSLSGSNFWQESHC